MLSYLGQVIVSMPGGLVVLESMPYLSGLLSLLALYVFIHHYQIFNRKKVDGTVLKCDLVSEFNGGMNKSSMFKYHLDAEFEFEWEGKNFKTKKVSSFETNSSFDAMAGEKAKRFKEGSNVVIYLNKSKPEKSVAENVFPYSIYLMGVVALIIYMMHDALVYTIYQNQLL